MDYVYATIIVVALAVLIVVLADGFREMAHHDRIIRKARCGHDWPDVDKWDMSHTYRKGVIPRL